jgi:protoporphyrinogen/coproporphyrinogen III oxidase
VVVVGGGVAGLAAAHALTAQAAADGGRVACTLVEASPRLGGKVLTERSAGFLVEGGPDTFVVHKPQVLELVRELGLAARLQGSDDARRRVWVVRRGRLLPVPDGLRLLVPTRLRPFLASPLISWSGKLRMGAEYLIPPHPPAAGGDESLGSFVRRRLGREALARLAEPLLAHIYLADPERLSLAAAFPALLDMERRHGGLLRAVRAGRHGHALAERPAEPPPQFLTLRGGLGELTAALAASIAAAPGGELVTGRRAVDLAPADDGAGGGSRWTVHLDDGRRFAADAVVLALPAFAAAELTARAAPAFAAALARIRYVSAAVVTLGYRERDLPRPLDGFGFFVPRSEGRRIVASTFSSSKFAGRAPARHALLRVFLGGAGGEAVMDLDDAGLARVAREELAALLDLRAEPALTRVHRWERGYPQYDVGHLATVAAAEALAPPGLLLAGSAYHGVGLPDCVRSGRAAARAAAGRLAGLGAPQPAAV